MEVLLSRIELRQPRIGRLVRKDLLLSIRLFLLPRMDSLLSKMDFFLLLSVKNGPVKSKTYFKNGTYSVRHGPSSA